MEVVADATDVERGMHFGLDGRVLTVQLLPPAQQVGEDPSNAFCFEIATPAASAQGCAPVPDEARLINGQPQRPSFALLGSDRFFAAIAPRGVEAMEVGVVGQAKAATSRSLEAGSAGTLLVATVGGRKTGSRDPSASRDYEVRLWTRTAVACARSL
jgi:hypothetical protein